MGSAGRAAPGVLGVQGNTEAFWWLVEGWECGSGVVLAWGLVVKAQKSAGVVPVEPPGLVWGGPGFQRLRRGQNSTGGCICSVPMLGVPRINGTTLKEGNGKFVKKKKKNRQEVFFKTTRKFKKINLIQSL